MKQLAALIVVFAHCAGCCSMGGAQASSDPPQRPQCAPNGAPNSKVAISTSCSLVVQMSEVCKYDGAGRLGEVASEPSGVCFCVPF